MSSSISSCRPPLAMIWSSPLCPLCSDLSILELDDSTLTNALQKSSIFTLEQIWTFLLSSSSWCLHRTPSTWHLLHLEHSSIERTPSALILFVVTKLICSGSNCCVHNRDTILTMISKVGRYEDLHWRSQTRHEIDYLEHTRWILKDIRRRTHNLTWFSSILTYVYEERTWESFINKFYTKRSNLPLDATRVFIFLLNLRLDYKNIPSIYAFSPCFSLS